MSAEIKTITLDSAGTQVIYPRTKQNAISDENGRTMGNVGFYGANVVASNVSQPILDGMYGIDTNNILATYTTQGTKVNYTSTVNCIVVIARIGTEDGIEIDGIKIPIQKNNASLSYMDGCFLIPLTIGQNIKFGASGMNIKATIYGVKRG